ncbi:MAG: UDP-2,3-diacylglucosamine diphosphatase [Chitinophagaceae bacterium]|nr:UDP-2,3-diacylglucosamine diphosphatase [Chitinophagaceae bacterium]
MQISPEKKIFFLSDFHLGIPDHKTSLERERRIIAFFESIKEQAEAIFIVGDMFDFWYEYRQVVPKGYVRLLGKLGELTDAGIAIHFFVGNHDMWMRDYFQKELNIPVYYEPKEFEFQNKKFLIGHGDGLGPGDHGYKMLKKVFRNPFCRWLFGVLPPYIGVGIANYFSRKSRQAADQNEEQFVSREREWLVTYSMEVLKQKHYDYFIFGHRHLPLDLSLDTNSRYINLGDWIRYSTYAVFDGRQLDLRSYDAAMEQKITRR